jgi:hypothetical protein
MKKCLFLTVFLLMTSMSFANVIKDKLYIAVDNGAAASLQKTIDTFTTEESIDDSCSVSCYGDIYYNGVYKTTVFASATAGDCVTAQTNCLQEAKAKAEKYIAAAE